MATYSHTGTTGWTNLMPPLSADLSKDGGVELVAFAANTGTVLYSDQADTPTSATQGFPVRLDNPAGVFIPSSRLKTTGKLWVQLSTSGDYLGARSY